MEIKEETKNKIMVLVGEFGVERVMEAVNLLQKQNIEKNEKSKINFQSHSSTLQTNKRIQRLKTKFNKVM